MLNEDDKKIVEEMIETANEERDSGIIHQSRFVRKTMKQRHIDGTVIKHGLAADRPTDGGAVDINGYFATDTGVMSMWDDDAWVDYEALPSTIHYLQIRLIAAATDVAADTDVGGDFIIPFGGTLLQSDTLTNRLFAWTDTAGTTGTMLVDVHLGGTTIMDTNKLDIESTEQGTQTAATQPDLSTTAVSAGDILTFDVDAIHTTAAKGLTVGLAIQES